MPIALASTWILLLIFGSAGTAGAASEGFLYTTGYSEGVHIFNATSGEPAGTLAATETCNELVASGDGSIVYVACGDYLKAYSTADNKEVASADYPAAYAHISSLVPGSDNRLYAADRYQKTITVYGSDLTFYRSIDLNPGTEAAAAGYLPVRIGLSPDARTLYAGCAYGKPGDAAALAGNNYSVLIYDVQTYEKLKGLKLLTTDDAGRLSTYHLQSLTVSPAGDYLWLSVYWADSSGNPGAGSSSALGVSLPISDSSDYQSLYVPPVPHDVAVTSDGVMLFVPASDGKDGTVVSYSTDTFLIAGLYTMSSKNLKRAVISPDGAKIYVSTDRGYSVIDMGGGVSDVATSTPVNLIAPIQKTVVPPAPATPAPTSTPTTTPSPDPPATPSPAPSKVPEATPLPAASPASGSPSPAATPEAVSPTPDSGSQTVCLGVPLIGVGMVLAVGPAAMAVRRKRQK